MIRFKRLEKQVHVRRNPFVSEGKKAPVETISIGVKVRPKYMNFVSKIGTMVWIYVNYLNIDFFLVQYHICDRWLSNSTFCGK